MVVVVVAAAAALAALVVVMMLVVGLVARLETISTDSAAVVVVVVAAAAAAASSGGSSTCYELLSDGNYLPLSQQLLLVAILHYYRCRCLRGFPALFQRLFDPCPPRLPEINHDLRAATVVNFSSKCWMRLFITPTYT